MKYNGQCRSTLLISFQEDFSRICVGALTLMIFLIREVCMKFNYVIIPPREYSAWFLSSYGLRYFPDSLTISGDRIKSGANLHLSHDF